MAGRKAEIDIQHYEESLRIEREERQYHAHGALNKQISVLMRLRLKERLVSKVQKLLGKWVKNGAGRIDIGGDGGQGGGAGLILSL